jgi:hypothetical protein
MHPGSLPEAVQAPSTALQQRSSTHYQEKLFNFEHDYLYPEQNRKEIGAIWNVRGIPAFSEAMW